MVYEGVVNGNDTELGVAGVVSLLRFGQPAIEARLVGGIDKLGVYAVDAFPLDDIERGEIFAQTLSLIVILKEGSENDERLLDHFRKANDS